MTKVTLLSKEDLETETLKKLGVQFQGTDFVNESRYTRYWTSTPALFYCCGTSRGFVVSSAGELSDTYVDNGYDVRPVLIPDDFEEITKNQTVGASGFNEVVYGEYYQIVSESQKGIIEACKSKKLNLTGKEYTVPCSARHREKQLPEYEYQDKKYVCKDDKWIEVTPIEWIVDQENKRLIAKKVLLTNVPLNYNNIDYNGYFETSSLYDFLNNQFINEIMPCAGQPEIEQTTDSLDKEIASLEAEIAQKKELIREWKESKLELLTAVKASLDAEIASLGIDSSKGTAYTKKPQNSQTTVKGQ